jgi:TPR repeat protein
MVEAVKRYTRAAESGHVAAQLNLGLLLATMPPNSSGYAGDRDADADGTAGDGGGGGESNGKSSTRTVGIDDKAAVAWFTRAANSGYGGCLRRSDFARGLLLRFVTLVAGFKSKK